MCAALRKSRCPRSGRQRLADLLIAVIPARRQRSVPLGGPHGAFRLCQMSTIAKAAPICQLSDLREEARKVSLSQPGEPELSNPRRVDNMAAEVQVYRDSLRCRMPSFAAALPDNSRE